MKDYLLNLIPRIKAFSGTLDKQEIFIDKPWIWLNENNDQQKFIFKRNGELIMSLDGQATIGKWEYISAAKSLLIDRINDKILLNQGFIDNAVMILKKDGVKGENLVFANEKLIPDLNVEKYLNSLYRNKYKIETILLNNGDNLEVYNESIAGYIGANVTLNLNPIGIGTFKTKNGNKIIIHEGKICDILERTTIKLNDEQKIVVEHKFNQKSKIVPGNYVFQEDGKTLLSDGIYNFGFFKSFKVKDGKIM